jgi:hypothetical protein
MNGPAPGAEQATPSASGSSSGGVSWKQLGFAGLALLLVAAIVVGTIVIVGGSDDSASAAEVELQPVSSAGANPFMPSVGTDQSAVTPPPSATSAAGNVTQYSGDLPGLYGGTRNVSSCDAEKMVVFLEQNPDKARAWAGALGISTTEIRTYVSGLTPVILRTDTWVTNHGYVDGVANEIPAVLEAGTAVLVDKYGYPVVKCFCGNPLTVPRVYRSPTYTGTRWPAFTPTSIIIIQKTTVIIDTFTLVDPKTGTPFTRPAGSSGTRDGNAPNTTPPTTAPPTTAPATTLPAVTAPPTAPPTVPQGPTLEEQEQAAANRVAQASQECYPFPAPIEDSTGADTSFGDVTPDSFTITVVTHTTSGGTQTFIWRVDRASGAFTPVNDLAQVASGHCSLLN